VPNRFFFSAVLSFCFVTAPYSYAADVTAQFDEAQAQEQLSEVELSTLRSAHVVFVEGLLAGAAKVVGQDYFAPEKKYLDTQNVEYTVIPTSSRKSKEKNSVKIAEKLRALETKDKKIILFTHSRGGVVVLDALLNNSDLWPMIVGWIALQTPFYGSASADHVTSKPVFNVLTRLYLRGAGSKMAILRELKTTKRLEYMNAHNDATAQLLHAFPVLTFGSTMPQLRHSKLGYYTHPSRGFAYTPGTDGVVMPQSTILRSGGFESSYIEETNIGHRQTIFFEKAKKESFDKLRFTQSLFKVFLNLQH
jgi:hypothetical protein